MAVEAGLRGGVGAGGGGGLRRGGTGEKSLAKIGFLSGFGFCLGVS